MTHTILSFSRQCLNSELILSVNKLPDGKFHVYLDDVEGPDSNDIPDDVIEAIRQDVENDLNAPCQGHDSDPGGNCHYCGKPFDHTHP